MDICCVLKKKTCTLKLFLCICNLPMHKKYSYMVYCLKLRTETIQLSLDIFVTPLLSVEGLALLRQFHVAFAVVVVCLFC